MEEEDEILIWTIYKYIVEIPISITDAEKFRENYENRWGAERRWEVDAYDYVYVNNYICPKTIIYKKYDEKSNKINRLELNVPLQKFVEITVAFNDLKIENEYLKDTVFSTSILKQILEQKEKEKKE